MTTIICGHGTGTCTRYTGPDPATIARHAREARAAIDRLASGAMLTLPFSSADRLATTATTARRVTGQVIKWASGIVGRDLEEPLPHVIGDEARHVVYFDAIRAALEPGQTRDLTREEWGLVIQDLHAVSATADRLASDLHRPMFAHVAASWGTVGSDLDVTRAQLLQTLRQQHPDWLDGIHAFCISLALLAQTIDLGQVARMRAMAPSDVGSPHHPVGQLLSRENYVPPARWCL